MCALDTRILQNPSVSVVSAPALDWNSNMAEDERTLCPPVEQALERPPTWTPRKLLVFFLLAFVYFLNWNCYGLLVSFFPHEAAKYGIRSTIVGFIFGIYNLAAFMASLFYCIYVIPKIGPYFVLIAGLFVAGGANIIFGFLNLISNPQLFIIYCFAVRAVGALGGAACDTAIFVILTQEFRDSIGTINGLLEFFTGLGSALGPVIGGGLYSVGGFRLPLILVGGILLLSLPIVWLLLPRKVYPVMKGGNTSFKEVMAIPGVIMICMTSFTHVVAANSIDPIFEPHAETYGVNTTGVGLLFLVFSVAYMISTPTTGWILQKKAWKRTLLVISSLATVVSLLFLGPAPFLTPFLPARKVWLLGVSMAFCGAADAVFFVPVLPEIHQYFLERGVRKGPATDSLAAGLYNGFYNLGGFVGPVVGGILADRVGFQWTTTIMAFLVCGQTFILVIFFCFSRHDLTHQGTEREHLVVNDDSTAKTAYGSLDA